MVAKSLPSEQLWQIRLASQSDINHIWTIYDCAAKKFATIPVLAYLAAEEETAQVFHEWLEHDRMYLAFSRDNSAAAGFIAARAIEGVVFIDEVSVHGDYQCRGLGTLLLRQASEMAEEIAREKGENVARVTLTTYPDVPWNGPWYRKRGFVEIEAEKLGSWHVEEVKKLVRPGWRRCCMIWEKTIASQD